MRKTVNLPTSKSAAVRVAVAPTILEDIELQGEQTLSLDEARKLPVLQRRRNGRRRGPNLATLYRWCGPAGCRGVRLETVKIGGTTATTRSAVFRFVARLSNPTINVVSSPSQERREFEKSERALEAMNVR